MLRYIQKNFSITSIVIIAIVLAYLTSAYFVVAVFSLIVPHTSRNESSIGAAIFFGIPLTIFWQIFFTILLVLIYKGSRKATVLLIVLLTLIAMGNIYDLSQQKKLFKLPFMQYKRAPLTVFEKNDYEKKTGMKIYAPTYLPQNLVPDDHILNQSGLNCPVLRMTFRHPRGYNRPIDIIESPSYCESELNIQLNSPTEIYEEMMLPKSGKLYYHVKSNSDSLLNIFVHIIKLRETIIQISSEGYITKDEIKKLVKSME